MPPYERLLSSESTVVTSVNVVLGVTEKGVGVGKERAQGSYSSSAHSLRYSSNTKKSSSATSTTLCLGNLVS
jgi:hypothetical protein